MTKSKNTNMEVRKKNRNRIYRYISQNGTVSNPDIAYQLKLSLPTVTLQLPRIQKNFWIWDFFSGNCKSGTAGDYLFSYSIGSESSVFLY